MNRFVVNRFFFCVCMVPVSTFFEPLEDYTFHEKAGDLIAGNSISRYYFHN